MVPLTNSQTILVVEDNEDVRNILSIYFRRNNFTVFEAEDGQKALSELEKQNLDLVLLDVLLPKIDGIEVLKRLRSTPKTKNLKVILMSAVLHTRKLVEQTSKYNVFSYIQKPFKIQNVLQIVNDAIGKSTDSSSSPEKIKRDKSKLIFTPPALKTTGDLAQTPFPVIMHLIFKNSITAKLSIESGQMQRHVYFNNGIPVYAQSSISDETLGAHLFNNGVLTPEQYKKVMDVMTRTGLQCGEVILKLELLKANELFEYLQQHLIDKVIASFKWFKGKYTISMGDDWIGDIIFVKMNAGKILLEGIQKHWTPQMVQKFVRITDNSHAFFTDRVNYVENQLNISTLEARVLQMVRHDLSIGEMIKKTGDISIVSTILLAFYIMEHIGFDTSRKKNEAPTEETSEIDIKNAKKAETQSQKIKLDKARKKSASLMSEYIELRTADYFTLLGISRAATNKEINEAFEEKQLRYHPDALADIKSGIIREKMEELYNLIHNAYETLKNEKSKIRYLKEIQKKTQRNINAEMRSATGRFSTMSAIKEHELYFNEGSALLRAGKYIKAKERFAYAKKLFNDPKYEAFEYWAGYLAEPVDNFSTTQQTFQTLQKENKENPLFPYLLGNLALKENDRKKAKQMFQTALKIDPKYINASRQLRLLKMRQETSEHSGLFEIFKRKDK